MNLGNAMPGKSNIESSYTPEEPNISNPTEREAVVSCSSDSCNGTDVF